MKSSQSRPLFYIGGLYLKHLPHSIDLIVRVCATNSTTIEGSHMWLTICPIVQEPDLHGHWRPWIYWPHSRYKIDTWILYINKDVSVILWHLIGLLYTLIWTKKYRYLIFFLTIIAYFIYISFIRWNLMNESRIKRNKQ